MVPVGHRQAPPQEREHRIRVAEQAEHLGARTRPIGIAETIGPWRDQRVRGPSLLEYGTSHDHR